MVCRMCQECVHVSTCKHVKDETEVRPDVKPCREYEMSMDDGPVQKPARPVVKPERPIIIPKKEAGPLTDKQKIMSENFIRLLEKRMPKALQAIKVLNHLANKSAYVWTDEQVRDAIGRLSIAIENLKKNFKI